MTLRFCQDLIPSHSTDGVASGESSDGVETSRLSLGQGRDVDCHKLVALLLGRNGAACCRSDGPQAKEGQEFAPQELMQIGGQQLSFCKAKRSGIE